jgi:prepilin-type processing-associated H-X9-DG protein
MSNFGLGTNSNADSLSWYSNRAVSYFVGLEADEKYPETILAGDRNVSVRNTLGEPKQLSLITNLVLGWTEAMHNNAGNIALADGSGRQMNSKEFQNQILAERIQCTNVEQRLLFPY